ncbi:MAG: hypothetical protein HYX24_05060 [Candidatus Aenigmarchaeota archaeon]|nr:hypothetical protein [Candidatus Aenigmarchaeota archaeon]
MPSADEHIKSIKSLFRDVEDKIKAGTLVEMQKLVGFACSEAACDLFALMLHRKNLISPGFNVNHRFFASEKIASEKFSFDFPHKAKLLPLLVNQERFRSILCYGRERERQIVEDCIKAAYKIREIVEEIIGETI